MHNKVQDILNKKISSSAFYGISIFSIIGRTSIKKLTEDFLLIINVCRDTWSVNKQFSKNMQEVCGSLK